MRKYPYTTGREVRRLKNIRDDQSHPKIKIFVLPGGRAPERKSEGAVGYDVCARAIVSAHEMDPGNNALRKTIFNFEKFPDDKEAAKHALPILKKDGSGYELAYQMWPGESVLVGVGFATEMPFPNFFWIAPRSGLATREGVIVTNAPGTVDPDYRGEAGVLVYNRNHHPFVLHHQMRIAQCVFMQAAIPKFEIAVSLAELSQTIRGTGGFGSTGLR